ncbi:neuronal acetylcholine receptor subunit alpha-9-like [Argopecten irradians]|uniref:neuronal acetylcholine receptor subunit alpha-9-like n=1 Tax=Argopecten irradians TaxID=31199 RepID=UPI003716F839
MMIHTKRQVPLIVIVCLLAAKLVHTNSESIDSCLRDTNPRLTDEQRLLMILMRSYNNKTRPVYNASHPVNVKIGLSITQIFDVDERNQVLTINVWLDQEWHDEKLSWDPADYNGLEVLRIPCTKLWLPDIVLYNSASNYNEKYMEALAMVSYTGRVFWPPIVKLKSSCEMDITFFPFDDQICKLKMGSWAYDGFQVDIFNRSTPIDLSNFVGHGEWELIDTKAVRNVVVYPCCKEPFPDVTFTVHIRRRTTYYLYNVIIPSVMLSSLALLGFWLHPDGGEKVTLGLTVLLSLSVFMLLIAENTPATSFYIPLLGIYLITTMSFTSGSVVVAVSVSSIHARGSYNKKVPSGLRKFIIWLSKGICMETKYINKRYHDDELPVVQIISKPMNGELNGNIQHTVCQEERRKIMEGYDEQVIAPSAIQSSKDEERHRRSHPGSLKKSHETKCCEPTVDKPDVYNGAILETLKCLLDQNNARQREEELKKQWEEVAMVIDRFLFWLFLFGNIISSLYLLVLCPNVMQNKSIDD